MGETAPYLLTGIAAIIASLGIKELWPVIFNGGKTECEKNLIRLCSQVAMLFNIMHDRFADEPRIQEGMTEIQDFIKELEGKKK